MYKPILNEILISTLIVRGDVYIFGKLIVNNNIYNERKDFINQSKQGIIPEINSDIYIVSNIIECTEEFMNSINLIINKKDEWDNSNKYITFTSEKLIFTGKIMEYDKVIVYSDELYYKIKNDKINKIKSKINK